MKINDLTVMDHVIGRLAPQVSRMAINANGDPARFSRFGLTVLADPLAGFPGPLAGVLAAMDWAAMLGADQVVTTPGDTPFLASDLVSVLQKAMTNHACPSIAVLKGDDSQHDWQPVFGLWPTALRGDLRDAINRGERKVITWALRHGAQAAVFPEDQRAAFFNINTPDDLAEARSRVMQA